MALRPPLAERMRPQEAALFFGQRHLLGEGMPLARMLAGEAAPHSMLLWGPPGCGKTTLARALARRAGAKWFSLSATTAGAREARAVIGEAEAMRDSGDERIRALFVDEAHHFNKTQQDLFLPHIESGLFVFAGATTENPSFEFNNALLSRLAVYHLRPLAEEDLADILRRALEELGRDADDDARRALILLADGDARRLLNAAERAADAAAAKMIDLPTVERTQGGERYRQFDKGGDYFYDLISALHKSVRGSDPDAALYWLCRVLDGGGDPRYAGRRLIRIASEDIGLADPRALALAIDADEAYRRLGSPEGELALAQAAIYLACAPKSDAAHRAFGKMRALVRADGTRPAPAHLRNAPTALMRREGSGKGYRHAHDEPGGYAAGVSYFPDGMRAARHYAPTDRGLELKIRERLATLRRLDRQARGE